MRVIYDLGANHGQNIDYYLLKADRVIAVEANPELALLIREKHSDDIANGRLHVVNAVVTMDAGNQPATFYLSNHYDVLSQFELPEFSSEFTAITVDSVNIIDLIDRYGAPYYVKIDLEHYDTKILTALFAYDLRPEFISCEIHEIQALDLLHRAGQYKKYKVIQGTSVAHEYKDTPIIDKDGNTHVISFADHSAGPFGDDIKGAWLSYEEFLQNRGSHWHAGWYDVHCTL